VRGKEELADHIGRSLSGEAYDGLGAGARIPLSSGADQHHGMFRFTWVLIEPQERRILLEGMDFVEMAADGRLEGPVDTIPWRGRYERAGDRQAGQAPAGAPQPRPARTVG
jgi:hypothetical protein